MKKHVIAGFILLLVHAGLLAQTTNPQPTPQGSSQLASAGLVVPVGVFADSHVAGLGISYKWSHHHFGNFGDHKADSISRLGFTAAATAEYYLGKKVTTAGNPFKYGNYFYFQVMPGLIYHALKRTDIKLAAGPAVSLYRSVAEFGIGASFGIEYFIQPQWSIGPIVLFKKQEEANALWSTGIVVSHSF